MKNNRGFAPMRNKRGMALVVSLLTSFILIALVASLFMIIATTARQAEYARNSAIALNLAEAGVADAIYRLNYCGTDGTGNYPFALSANPFGTSNFDPLPADILTTSSYLGLQDPAISGTLNNGNYYVGLINSTTGTDTIIAVGVYKGIRRILSVPLRGNSDVGTARQEPTASIQGISEAFNKHVIYADTITSDGVTVAGNIAYKTTCASTSGTKTKVDPALFHIPALNPFPDLPGDPGGGHFFKNGQLDGASPLPAGVSYDGNGSPSHSGGTDTYIFASSYTETYRVYVQIADEPLSTQHNGNATINGATIQNFLKADGTITIQGTPTFSGTYTALNPLNGIPPVSGITINGDLIVEGGPLTLDGVTVTGSVLSDNNIILSGSPSTITVPPASTKEAAILIKSTTATTITVSAGASPIVSLGPNQKSFIINYTTGATAGITINANLTTTLSPNSKNQSTAVAYVSGVGTASIFTGDAVSVNGLLYASSLSGTGDITIGSTLANTGTITGTVVAKGTVTLNGGFLTYDATNFKNPISSSDIYQSFSGGERVYVPVWEEWSLK